MSLSEYPNCVKLTEKVRAKKKKKKSELVLKHLIGMKFGRGVLG